MDLDLTSEQELLRATTARFVADTLPLARVRQLVDGHGELPPRYGLDAAQLGWFANLAPEQLGGGSVSGSGVLDAVILAEERGRQLQPGAFIDTNVVVAALSMEGTAEQQAKILPSLIAGETAAVWAIADPTGDWSGGSGVTCTAHGDGYRLSGVKGLIVEAQLADWILVTTSVAEGPVQFLVAVDTPGIVVEELSGFDLTRTLCEVRFDELEVPASSIVGGPGVAAQCIERQLQLAAVLCVAESVGAMDHLFTTTLEYCKNRIAFGRPIGSFQAVKHQLADTSLLLEESLAASSGAARAVQQQHDRCGEVASMAKAFVADAGVELAHACWQNFGGIAYTWEHDFHLYLRRLTTNAALYGSAAWHRERICALEGL